MKLGSLEIDLQELQRFIVSAKKQGYGSGIEPIREADGSKTFTFQEGSFHYTDNYAGSWQAPGAEIVRWRTENGQRIWQMFYSGGILPKFWKDVELKRETFEFLIRALSLVSFKRPFRGPGGYEGRNFKYGTEINGSVQRFSGYEWIVDKKLDEIVFSQEFIGGLVVPR